MKLLGRSKPEKPRAAGGQGRTPRPGAAVRLRLTMATGAKEDLVIEVPTTVNSVEPAVSATGRTHLLLEAAGVDFLPAAPDLTIEHALVWTTSGGHMELPVLVSSLEGPLWRVVVTGPVRQVQRRNFVRIAVRMPARVVLIAAPEQDPDEDPDGNPDGNPDVDDLSDEDRDGDAATAATAATGATGATGATAPDPDGVPELTEWEGILVDLGEGGVRCAVRGTPPPQGSRISVSFPDGNIMIHCLGVVVRFLPVHGIDGHSTALAIRFDDPDEHGDTIRRLVFAEQLRLRQSHLETRDG